LKIINLKFFTKKDCFGIQYFFTFAEMKKSQNTRNFSSTKNENSSSFLRILRRFFTIKDTFSFALFPYLKAENEKLQIVFANIRV